MQSTIDHPAGDGELLLVDKPAGWTSFDVVNKLRYATRIRKIGHAGTLDPLATGLLLVCMGKMTKQIERFSGLDKEYEVGIRVGATTPSHDAATPVSTMSRFDHLTYDDVERAIDSFEGEYTQLPPMWSAAKVSGKRLYAYARKGKVIERRPRTVVVHRITISRIALPDVFCTVRCSKGTYIRTLVDDIGRLLGCGAFVSSLRRIRIGDFNVSDAWALDEIARLRRVPVPVAA